MENKDNNQEKSIHLKGTEDPSKHSGWMEASSDVILDTIGETSFNAVFGNREAIKNRQHLLDPSKYRSEYKRRNLGKMPNNLDPYPVDLKIEELEFHKPDVKVYEWDTHIHGEQALKCAMQVADRAEKRLVKLENMLATLHRMFFRMSSRMVVNCQYYGGTTPNEKYKCIRCLCDDKIADGKMVQLDQCLYCTRFEPVLGQTYECLNDLGANISAVLDDNQSGFINMDEYVHLNRVEEQYEEKQDAKIDLSLIETLDENEYALDNLWDEGFAMDWTLVPKEEQKVHINWRQSIIDDGSSLMRLPSFTASGTAVYNSNGASGILDFMRQNKASMDQYSGNSTVKSAISNGRSREKDEDHCYNYIQKNQTAINNLITKYGLKAEAIMLCTLCYINGNIENTIRKYGEVEKSLGTTNPILILFAMNYGNESVLGKPNSNTVPRLDKVILKKDITDTETTPEEKISFDWNSRDNILYTTLAPLMVEQLKNMGNISSKGLSIFPELCYLYLKVIPKCQQSQYDNGNFAFPFTDQQLKNPGVWYTSKYGEVRSGGSVHKGIDLAGNENMEIHAVHDGIVVDAGDTWDPHNMALIIQHTDGSTYSRYLHNNKILVRKGQRVSKGQVVALLGNKGHSFGAHLHLEISTGDGKTKKSDTDPLNYFPNFKKQNIKVGSRIMPK